MKKLIDIDLKDVLRKKGYKATPARLAILTMFMNIHKPLAAEDIYKKMKGTDEATIYRTLTAFEKSGMIRRVDLRRDSVYYELGEDHHHHIICICCGLIEDFDTCEIDKVTKQILLKSASFKTINEHSFELFGMCKKCKA